MCVSTLRRIFYCEISSLKLKFVIFEMVMKIAGLQKVSTIDYPGKISCIIFLYGCNFRCGFCYNPGLVTKEFDGGYTEDEVLDFLKKRKGKLDAVCITGGDPLISLEKSFVEKIKDLGYLVKVDTNGSFPERLKELIDSKLVDYIAMDIKGSSDRYTEIAGVNVDLKKIEKSIKLINDFGSGEFRTTILERFHDEAEVEKMGKWLSKVCDGIPRKIFLQGFRNDLGKMIDGDFEKDKNTSEKYLMKLKGILDNYFGEVEVRM